jgi:hypothetical protein
MAEVCIASTPRHNSTLTMFTPTNSERLLRDTLHRHNSRPTMQETPPTSRKNTSSSNSSLPSPSHPRSASPSTYYLSQPRQSSPSPSNRKRASLPAHLHDDQGVSLPITVHEMALRARLERVLGDTARRDRRSSNEVRDEDGAWPWRERERERASLLLSSHYTLDSLSHIALNTIFITLSVPFIHISPFTPNTNPFPNPLSEHPHQP